MENTEENCEMIWKIWKKIVKRYGRKASRIVIRYEKYRRKLNSEKSWKIHGNYERKIS
jgi:hypothetical protein